MASSSSNTFRTMKIGGKDLLVYPRGSNLQFRVNSRTAKNEAHQVLLDNLWNAKNVAEKSSTLVALAYYIDNLPAQSFAYYVVVKGKTPGIYSSWESVIENTKEFQTPFFKGFRILAEALNFARSSIGINFFIDHACRTELQKAPVQTLNNQPSTSYASAVQHDSTNRLEFCRHCDTLTKNFNLLNNKCREYNQEINSQKEKIAELISVINRNTNIINFQNNEMVKITDQLILEKSKPPTIVTDTVYIPEKTNEERPFEYISPWVFFKTKIILSKLPQEVLETISQKAKINFELKLVKVQQFLRTLAIHSPRHRDIRVQASFLKRPNRICTQKCKENKIDGDTCSCQLAYFLYMAHISLTGYRAPIIPLDNNNNTLEITPQLLMDFGMVSSMVIRDPEETDQLGKQLSLAVLKQFQHGAGTVKVEFISAPPEWNGLEVLPAIHRIKISTAENRYLPEFPLLEGRCTDSIPEQLVHRRNHFLAYRHYFCQWNTSYHLFSENLVQKIYTQIQVEEVEFETVTAYPEIFTSYYNQYRREFEDDAQRNDDYPDLDGDNDDDLAILMGDEGMINLDGMQEG